MPPVSTADLLKSFQSNQQSQPGVGSSIAQGFEFAQSRAGLELKQEQLEQRKKEAESMRADQAIRSGNFVLDQLTRLSETPNKAARKIIAGQISRVSGSSGFEMDPVNLKELESDEEVVRALTNKMTKLIEVAPDDIKSVMQSSIVQTIATQPLSVTRKKLDEFQKVIESRPAKEREEVRKERDLQVKERGVTAKEGTLKLGFDKLKQEGVIKVQELEQKRLDTKDKKEQVRIDRTIKERKEVEDKPEIQQYVEVRTAVRNALDAIEADTPLQDVSAIFNLVKVLDPGSVVRGSEVELVTRPGSLGDKINGFFQETTEGRKFIAARREEFNSILRSNLTNRMEAAATTIAPRAVTNKKFGLVRADWDPTEARFKKDLKLLKSLGGIPDGGGASNIRKNAKSLDSSFPGQRRQESRTSPITRGQMAKISALRQKVASGNGTEREREVLQKAEQALSSRGAR